MPRGSGKGSKFEREICRALSLWWSEGLGLEPRDDIFWRSSQSGGRATFRTQKGKATHGSYGDIAAIDPIGAPLLKFWTIEIKCGRNIGTPWDCFDSNKRGGSTKFETALMQAYRSHKEAGSYSWLLIVRRDFRKPMVYYWFEPEVPIYEGAIEDAPFADINVPLKGIGVLRFFAEPLDVFLRGTSPKRVKRYTEKNK